VLRKIFVKKRVLQQNICFWLWRK